jgi:hypothetical protein
MKSFFAIILTLDQCECDPNGRVESPGDARDTQIQEKVQLGHSVRQLVGFVYRT